MASSVGENENCLVSSWSCKPQMSWRPVLSSFKYSTAEAIILKCSFSLSHFENLVFHQDSSSTFRWALQLYIIFSVCSCRVEKLAEQEKVAGELQRSLEQKDDRMNGMQWKIEVCTGKCNVILGQGILAFWRRIRENWNYKAVDLKPVRAGSTMFFINAEGKFVERFSVLNRSFKKKSVMWSWRLLL